MSWYLRVSLAIALSALALPSAHAHPLAPAYLLIDAGSIPTELTLTYGVDADAPRFTTPCASETIAAQRDGDLLIVRTRWSCAPTGPLRLAAEAGAPPLIVELRRPGSTITAVLDAAHPVLDLSPHESDTLATLGTWTALGMDHLLAGMDHLLLLLGLVLLVGLRRPLVAVLTAFTLGHSLSLALGATGVITLPSALVESAIAATLIAVALDLAAPRSRTTPSIFVRAPWLAGAAIGLVHGLGFASALIDLDLTSDSVAVALLGFNLGLELAQLAIVLGLAALIAVTRRARVGSDRLVRATPHALITSAGWLIGVVASAWLIERMITAI